ncbi:cytochrome c1 [Marinomonas balearica]|uniref:Ubiquinol-cytochrome c reductase cytochrome c1 subunit n=1 Tax=Marinomonas balearica TaxID=491947 RepID=A0A4R6MDU0_9GAMM|nr:cytochrome c1 [Marinomonas balearica]TDO99907.1 ubiquinol-cytochrome c reductase cytochrome c1 subunit [Marinomonas balearica]
MKVLDDSAVRFVGNIFLLMGLMLFSSVGLASQAKPYYIGEYEKNTDRDSIERGFVTYMQFCASCHKSEYVRHRRISADLEIPWEEYKEKWLGGAGNLPVFLSNSWTSDTAKEVFGVVPPDLSLIAAQKSPDWLYRYLHSFYADSSQPLGSNNLLAPNVKMPNVLAFMQGVIEKQSCVNGDQKGADQCITLVKTEQGVMEDHEFSAAIQDLTNFFVYLSEPSRLEAELLAPKVLLFILVFCLIAYLLKREFWKDIPK